ncbi:hypothetical protein SAMN05446037_100250 [Anaerovirgula multivorans]|uniref:DUF1292 domain-containing protein n=1 Tax=Anaerovirgula multivorans TaxID=312168 RepID=A0A239AHL6_9FIRM|nr:hypothetical protein [Anaerovirgula multivorans]SNR95156.1 hypothetical protein SAMN05446037_100250 [Anaerovirgula multivorans]
MLKINGKELVQVMVESADKDGEIGILKHDSTGKTKVIFKECGWLDTYADQNQYKIIASFTHCPSDNGYNEESEYTEDDAEYELDKLEKFLETKGVEVF